MQNGKALIATVIGVGISLAGLTTYLNESLGDRITRLEQRMNSRFDQVDQRFDRVEQRLERLEERMGRVEGVIIGLPPEKKHQ